MLQQPGYRQLALDLELRTYFKLFSDRFSPQANTFPAGGVSHRNRLSFRESPEGDTDSCVALRADCLFVSGPVTDATGNSCAGLWPKSKAIGLSPIRQNGSINPPTQQHIMNEKLNSSSAPEPVGLYPHARRVGNLLFMSGVGPRKKGTRIIPGANVDNDGNITSYDIEAQCRSVFENVRTIVEDAGSSWNQIVDVTVFLTNMDDDFKTYNKVYAEYFADNQPCRTTVEVNKLPTPIAIELKCIATIE